MVYGTERPLPKRGRTIAAVVFWLLVGIPVQLLLEASSIWLALVALPFGMWLPGTT